MTLSCDLTNVSCDRSAIVRLDGFLVRPDGPVVRPDGFLVRLDGPVVRPDAFLVQLENRRRRVRTPHLMAG